METINYIELVQKAQLGDKLCLNRLAEAVRERLYAYVYRYTLADDLTHDIVQESILKMLETLSELRKADQFWPWLYKIALNKLRLHHRNQLQNKTIPDPDKTPAQDQDSQEAIAGMVYQEFKETVFAAIQQLKPDHRSVINLRCYDRMQFSQIAKAMDCSEFAAQKLFYRAQKSLKKQLARHGFGKGSVLMALILFGKLTAPSKAAAAQITAATVTTKVGLTASLASMAATKTALISLTTAAALTTGAIVATSTQTAPEYSKNENTYSYIQPEKPLVDQADMQYWYYTPSEAAGSVMMRVKGLDKAGNNLHCIYLQNADANYHFDKGTNTVHINNFHQWDEDLSVWRLPADSLKLKQFLQQIDGKNSLPEIIYPSKAGTLFIVNTSRSLDSEQLEVAHCNLLGEDFFKVDWPANAKVVDNRDEMHKRGWTYFTISGQINGKPVNGTGRIPFVYSQSNSQSPWLKLTIGDEIYTDTEFDGLCRSWEGLHTIDTIRRDAANKQIPFETTLRADEQKARITLTTNSGKIIYTIDMQKDIVETITFTGDRQGQLTFDYLQKVDDIKHQFTPPSYQNKKNGTFCVLNIN